MTTLRSKGTLLAIVSMMLLTSASDSSMNFSLFGPFAASANSTCRPVNGSATTQVVPPPTCTSPVAFCTEGRVIGGLQGDLTLTATSFVPAGDPSIPSVSFFIGESVITARNGDTLVGTDAGAFDLSTGTVATLITWTGGTGQYAGASGYIRVAADLDGATGTVTSTYTGVVCTP